MKVHVICGIFSVAVVVVVVLVTVEDTIFNIVVTRGSSGRASVDKYTTTTTYTAAEARDVAAWRSKYNRNTAGRLRGGGCSLVAMVRGG